MPPKKGATGKAKKPSAGAAPPADDDASPQSSAPSSPAESPKRAKKKKPSAGDGEEEQENLMESGPGADSPPSSPPAAAKRKKPSKAEEERSPSPPPSSPEAAKPSKKKEKKRADDEEAVASRGDAESPSPRKKKDRSAADGDGDGEKAEKKKKRSGGDDEDPSPSPSATASKKEKKSKKGEEGDGDGGGAAEAAAPAAASADYAKRLKRFFKKYDPEKIESIPTILTKFAGREEAYLKKLVEKYGPEPSAAASSSAAAESAASAADKKASKKAPTAAAAAGRDPLSPANLPMEERLRRMFMHYAPEKLENLAPLMANSKGKLDVLLGRLVEKYGPEPRMEPPKSRSQVKEELKNKKKNGREGNGDVGASASDRPLPELADQPGTFLTTIVRVVNNETGEKDKICLVTNKGYLHLYSVLEPHGPCADIGGGGGGTAAAAAAPPAARGGKKAPPAPPAAAAAPKPAAAAASSKNKMIPLDKLSIVWRQDTYAPESEGLMVANALGRLAAKSSGSRSNKKKTAEEEEEDGTRDGSRRGSDADADGDSPRSKGKKAKSAPSGGPSSSPPKTAPPSYHLTNKEHDVVSAMRQNHLQTTAHHFTTFILRLDGFGGDDEVAGGGDGGGGGDGDGGEEESEEEEPNFDDDPFAAMAYEAAKAKKAQEKAAALAQRAAEKASKEAAVAAASAAMATAVPTWPFLVLRVPQQDVQLFQFALQRCYALRQEQSYHKQQLVDKIKAELALKKDRAMKEAMAAEREEERENVRMQLKRKKQKAKVAALRGEREARKAEKAEGKQALKAARRAERKSKKSPEDDDGEDEESEDEEDDSDDDEDDDSDEEEDEINASDVSSVSSVGDEEVDARLGITSGGGDGAAADNDPHIRLPFYQRPTLLGDAMGIAAADHGGDNDGANSGGKMKRFVPRELPIVHTNPFTPDADTVRRAAQQQSKLRAELQSAEDGFAKRLAKHEGKAKAAAAAARRKAKDKERQAKRRQAKKDSKKKKKKKSGGGDDDSSSSSSSSSDSSGSEEEEGAGSDDGGAAAPSRTGASSPPRSLLDFDSIISGGLSGSAAGAYQSPAAIATAEVLKNALDPSLIPTNIRLEQKVANIQAPSMLMAIRKSLQHPLGGHAIEKRRRDAKKALYERYRLDEEPLRQRLVDFLRIIRPSLVAEGNVFVDTMIGLYRGKEKMLFDDLCAEFKREADHKALREAMEVAKIAAEDIENLMAEDEERIERLLEKAAEQQRKEDEAQRRREEKAEMARQKAMSDEQRQAEEDARLAALEEEQRAYEAKMDADPFIGWEESERFHANNDDVGVQKVLHLCTALDGGLCGIESDDANDLFEIENDVALPEHDGSPEGISNAHVEAFKKAVKKLVKQREGARKALGDKVVAAVGGPVDAEVANLFAAEIAEDPSSLAYTEWIDPADAADPNHHSNRPGYNVAGGYWDIGLNSRLILSDRRRIGKHSRTCGGDVLLRAFGEKVFNNFKRIDGAGPPDLPIITVPPPTKDGKESAYRRSVTANGITAEESGGKDKKMKKKGKDKSDRSASVASATSASGAGGVALSLNTTHLPAKISTADPAALFGAFGVSVDPFGPSSAVSPLLPPPSKDLLASASSIKALKRPSVTIIEADASKTNKTQQQHPVILPHHYDFVPDIITYKVMEVHVMGTEEAMSQEDATSATDAANGETNTRTTTKTTTFYERRPTTVKAPNHLFLICPLTLGEQLRVHSKRQKSPILDNYYHYNNLAPNEKEDYYSYYPPDAAEADISWYYGSLMEEDMRPPRSADYDNENPDEEQEDAVADDEASSSSSDSDSSSSSSNSTGSSYSGDVSSTERRRRREELGEDSDVDDDGRFTCRSFSINAQTSDSEYDTDRSNRDRYDPNFWETAKTVDDQLYLNNCDRVNALYKTSRLDYLRQRLERGELDGSGIGIGADGGCDGDDVDYNAHDHQNCNGADSIDLDDDPNATEFQRAMSSLRGLSVGGVGAEEEDYVEIEVSVSGDDDDDADSLTLEAHREELRSDGEDEHAILGGPPIPRPSAKRRMSSGSSQQGNARGRGLRKVLVPASVARAHGYATTPATSAAAPSSSSLPIALHNTLMPVPSMRSPSVSRTQSMKKKHHHHNQNCPSSSTAVTVGAATTPTAQSLSKRTTGIFSKIAEALTPSRSRYGEGSAAASPPINLSAIMAVDGDGGAANKKYAAGKHSKRKAQRRGRGSRRGGGRGSDDDDEASSSPAANLASLPIVPDGILLDMADDMLHLATSSMHSKANPFKGVPSALLLNNNTGSVGGVGGGPSVTSGLTTGAFSTPFHNNNHTNVHDEDDVRTTASMLKASADVADVALLRQRIRQAVHDRQHQSSLKQMILKDLAAMEKKDGKGDYYDEKAAPISHHIRIDGADAMLMMNGGGGGDYSSYYSPDSILDGLEHGGGYGDDADDILDHGQTNRRLRLSSPEEGGGGVAYYDHAHERLDADPRLLYRLAARQGVPIEYPQQLLLTAEGGAVDDDGANNGYYSGGYPNNNNTAVNQTDLYRSAMLAEGDDGEAPMAPYSLSPMHPRRGGRGGGGGRDGSLSPSAHRPNDDDDGDCYSDDSDGGDGSYDSVLAPLPRLTGAMDGDEVGLGGGVRYAESVYDDGDGDRTTEVLSVMSGAAAGAARRNARTQQHQHQNQQQNANNNNLSPIRLSESPDNILDQMLVAMDGGPVAVTTSPKERVGVEGKADDGVEDATTATTVSLCIPLPYPISSAAVAPLTIPPLFTLSSPAWVLVDEGVNGPTHSVPLGAAGVITTTAAGGDGGDLSPNSKAAFDEVFGDHSPPSSPAAAAAAAAAAANKSATASGLKKGDGEDEREAFDAVFGDGGQVGGAQQRLVVKQYHRIAVVLSLGEGMAVPRRAGAVSSAVVIEKKSAAKSSKEQQKQNASAGSAAALSLAVNHPRSLLPFSSASMSVDDQPLEPVLPLLLILTEPQYAALSAAVEGGIGGEQQFDALAPSARGKGRARGRRGGATMSPLHGAGGKLLLRPDDSEEDEGEGEEEEVLVNGRLVPRRSGMVGEGAAGTAASTDEALASVRFACEFAIPLSLVASIVGSDEPFQQAQVFSNDTARGASPSSSLSTPPQRFLLKGAGGGGSEESGTAAVVAAASSPADQYQYVSAQLYAAIPNSLVLLHSPSPSLYTPTPSPSLAMMMTVLQFERQEQWAEWAAMLRRSLY